MSNQSTTNQQQERRSSGGNNNGSTSSSSNNHNGTSPSTPSSDHNNTNGSRLNLEELLYSSSSFHAIATPVSVTMILTALCVIHVNTEETLREGEQALSAAYEAFDNTNTTSDAATLGISLLNALIICCVIGGMTFVIVLLYKYNCIKCLIGYMVCSSILLLGFLGSTMLIVAIEKYKIDIDVFSFYFFMWNFAAVGTTSIFWGKGIPLYITQGYLVCTSVILAWQLSHFNYWTAWALLVMLALYDLCAVLTPCGPLKALVNVMQQSDAPPLPGLLYEAELPAAARRPRSRQQQQQQQQQQQSSTSGVPPSPMSTEEAVIDSLAAQGDTGIEVQLPSSTTPAAITTAAPVLPPAPSGRLPLAIAKLYRLELVEPVETIPRRPSFTPLLSDQDNTATTSTQPSSGASDGRAPNQILAQQYTPEQLCRMVNCWFPRGGGRIDRQRNSNGDVRYAVKDRHGVIKRILLIDDETGRVFEERTVPSDDDGPSDNSIKLGLGDFIFYSVLVSKAVQYSFTTFAACMLVVLAGLGGTLILLAVYQHALPALPISIFLGVLFYLLTRLLIEPWIHEIFQQPLYV